MKGIIFCKKLETGAEQLKEIIDSYHSIGIHLFEKIAMGNRYEKALIANFDNGDNWIVVKATGDNVRGHSCNVAYIDRMIPDNVVEAIIMPTIKASPYQAYKYYNWSNW